MKAQGIEEKPEGIHDEYTISAIMASVDPVSIRAEERRRKGLLSINSVKLDPIDRTIAMGRRLVAHRTDLTVAAIRKAFAGAACGS